MMLRFPLPTGHAYSGAGVLVSCYINDTHSSYRPVSWAVHCWHELVPQYILVHVPVAQSQCSSRSLTINCDISESCSNILTIFSNASVFFSMVYQPPNFCKHQHHSIITITRSQASSNTPPPPVEPTQLETNHYPRAQPTQRNQSNQSPDLFEEDKQQVDNNSTQTY
jgi:hypothetical protein